MTVDDLQLRIAEEFYSSGSKKKAAGRKLGVIQEIIVHYSLREMGLGDSVFLEGRLPEYNPTKPALTHNAEFTIHEVLERQEVELDKTTHRGRDSSYRFKRSQESEPQEINEKLASRLYEEGGVRWFTRPVKKKSDIDFRKTGGFRVVEWLEGRQGELRKLRLRPVAFIECKRVGLEEGTSSGPQTIEKAKQAAYVANHSSAIQGMRGPFERRGAYYDGEHEEWVFKPYEEIWQSIIDGELLVEHAIRSAIFVGNHVNWYPGGGKSKDLQVLIDNYDWAIWVEDRALVEFARRFLFNDESKVGEAFRKHMDDNHGYFTKQKMWEPAHQELKTYFSNHFDEICENWFRVLARSEEESEEGEEAAETIRDLGEELARLSSRSTGAN